MSVNHAHTSSPIDILIVIVNYKTARLTVDCLQSLEPEIRAHQGTVRVMVTDNASPDDSITVLMSAIDEHNWGEWAKVQPLEVNGGFAYGNNEAIRPALASSAPPNYVWLLNPDTVVRPGALRALVDFMESHPDVGIAGSRLEWPDSTPQISTFRFPSIMGEIEDGLRLGVASKLLSYWVVPRPVPTNTSACDWVAGASMMVRRSVFKSIGLMDNSYFMYFEEVDFCRRARKAGYGCWYVPDSRVVHLVGQSSGVTHPRHARKQRPSYWFEARRRYMRSHLGRAGALVANIGWSLGFSTYQLRRMFLRKPDTSPQHLLRDFIYYNFLHANKS